MVCSPGGGGRRVAGIVLFDGHLLSTSTVDLVWTAVSWLGVRAARTGEDRPWLVAGVVLGVGLLNKPLPAAAGLAAGRRRDRRAARAAAQPAPVGGGGDRTRAVVAARTLPWASSSPSSSRAVVFTANYGQAGALQRYGPALAVPPVYSGQNAYHDWGPPPDSGRPVIAVGLPARTREAHFAGCRPAARVDNAVGVDNDEQGTLVSVCTGPRGSWSRVWPKLLRLG